MMEKMQSLKQLDELQRVEFTLYSSVKVPKPEVL